MESFKFESKVTGFKLKEKKAESTSEVVVPTDVKLPNDAPARVRTLKAEGKKWYLTTVYRDDGVLFALFCQSNHHEKNTQTLDAVIRLQDLALRKGVLPEHVEKTVSKINGDNNVSKLARMISLNLRHGILPASIVNEIDKMKDVFVGSFLFQIKKFLGKYIEEGQAISGEVCSSCGSDKLVFSEGCLSCLDCGGSKCS